MMVNFTYACWKWQFFNKNISQGSVATCLRCGGIFNYHCAANLPLSMSVKEFWKSAKKWQLQPWVWCLPFFGTRYITVLHVLQHVQNLLAHVVLQADRSAFSASLLQQLHWLPVEKKNQLQIGNPHLQSLGLWISCLSVFLTYTVRSCPYSSFLGSAASPAVFYKN